MAPPSEFIVTGSIARSAILRFFAPQGRHVAPTGVKFGMEAMPNFTPVGATTRL